MEHNLYHILNSYVMAALAYTITIIHLYSWKHKNGYKRIPKFIKALNWAFLATVYLVDAIIEPAPADVRIWFRLSLGLLFMVEIAYHSDTILDIYHRARNNG